MTTANIVIVTKGEDAVSNQAAELDAVALCSHEEADTCLFLHARHAVYEGHKSLMIDANDTNRVVIATSVMSALMQLGLEKMRVNFSKGEKTDGFQYMTWFRP